jgi:iron complex transport system substrate-binding protein
MKRRQQGILTGMPFMANVAPRTFVDDLGRKIYLAQAPTRLVSLAPSITETLYAIGLGDRVVGVTEFCDYPPEARDKPRVGYSHPNLETIVALQLRATLFVRMCSENWSN